LTISLDTNVIVDVIRGRPDVRASFLRSVLSGDWMVVSAIVWHELRFGALVSGQPEREWARLDQVLGRFDKIDFDAADAAATAELRAELRQKGAGIGAYDALIAGQARARGWTVATANTREFGRVDGLNVVDWTDPTGQE